MFSHIMQENTLFPGKIYTAGTNFTRPPVAPVATNLNSATQVFGLIQHFLFKAEISTSFQILVKIYFDFVWQWGRNTENNFAKSM